MSWFNKGKMSEQDIYNEEIQEGDGDAVPFDDKRRFNEAGERINVEVKDASNPGETISNAEVKSPEVIKLENALKEIMIRCEAAESKLQSVQARFEDEKANLERETAERRERMKRSLEQKADQDRFNFLGTLLPVLDNLNLAIEASNTDSSFEHLLDGVKGTARSFEKSLLNVGVEAIASVGESFNPELHEAVDLVEVNEENEGKVTAEYARGYTINGRLLRPARVQVGKAAQSKEAAEK